MLSGTQAVGQFCSLGRNIIVARVLSPADFGVAAIFLMTVNLMDMISNMSLDRLLVQAEDGDEEDFQRTAHSLNLFRPDRFQLLFLLQNIRGSITALFKSQLQDSQIFPISSKLLFKQLQLPGLLN